MQLLTGSSLLNDQQRRFVRFVAKNGCDWERAAEAAGYHADYGRELRKNPAIAAALHEMIQLDLKSELAPMAYRVAKTLLEDTNVSPRVRADVAFKILDRAGHIVPTRKDSAPQKALSEMSQAELLAFIERNQAEIDKAEAELAGQAKDISHQARTVDDAKPLNFLD